MNKKCKCCGIEFDGSEQKKYCSDLCKGRMKTVRRDANMKRSDRRIAMYAYTCQQCGIEYHPKSKERNKFCSQDCFVESRKKPEEQKPKLTQHCIVCGVVIGTNTAKKYCSEKCRYEENKEKYLKQQREAYTPTAKVDRTCSICGNIFKGKKTLAFCSSECRTVKAKEDKANQQSRRRAIKKKAFVSRVIRNEIYNRDEWMCQICGKKVDNNKKAPHPLSPSIDHIIPLAKGGTHEPKNVQLAHFYCNSKKSDGLVESGEGLG